MLPIECVVRGYLAGSGWKDYLATGEVCGHALPAGPGRVGAAARADLHARDEGPDRPRREHRPRRRRRARRRGALRRGGAADARALPLRRPSTPPARGIILADTKLEFGRRRATAASSSPTRRSRPTRRGSGPPTSYEPGGPQPSFDKQFVRDYCEALGWDKTAPRPRAPGEVVEGTRARYIEAFERLTGIGFDDYLADPSVVLAMKATVLVRPKAGSSTPRGRRSRASLRHLGFAVERDAGRTDSSSSSSRPTTPGEARAQVERMCEQLLANPLIESYEIELHDARVSERRGPRTADRGRRLPRLERRPRRRARARAARAPTPRASGTPRPSCRRARRRSSFRAGSPTATTSAAARSPASRRSWPRSPSFAARGRARARHLQRLPDPDRGAAAPGRAATERVALVRLPRRRAPGRARQTRPFTVALRRRASR